MTQQAYDHVPTQLADQHATVLVVEDDRDIQSVLEQILTMAGYDVMVVSSGAAALDMLEHEHVDLVLLDLMLPDMDGYQVCAQMRQTMLSRVPIVMLTAKVQQGNVTKGLELGADDYIKKPFVPQELLLRVEHLVRRYDDVRSAEQEATALRTTLHLVQRQLEVSRDATEVEATLRREFLHNVTTHMRALSNIVEAAMRKLPPSNERDVVHQIKSRVRSAALVYEVSEALQHDPVQIDKVIHTIATALKSMYRPWRRVQLHVNAAAGDLPAMVASPIAMVVNELITNCFKHAFPENRFGRIDVATSCADAFVLTVRDDGVGFDPDAPSGGQGRGAVTQLVHGLNGSVEWHSTSTGTQAMVRVPLAAATEHEPA